MAHRGRLNALGCVFRKPYSQIFGEFKEILGRNGPDNYVYNFEGDVKYHMGTHHLLKND